MRNFILGRAAISMMFAMSALSLNADVRIANVFGNNGIIQHGKPVPVWGLSDPSEKIKLTIKGCKGCAVNQAKEAVADRHGKWIVILDPLRAGDKFHIFAKGKTSKDAR